MSAEHDWRPAFPTGSICAVCGIPRHDHAHQTSTEPLDPSAYDPRILDIDGSHADVAWLRSCGVTNVPDRLQALLDEVDRLADENAKLRARLDRVQGEADGWEAEIDEQTRAKEFGIAEGLRTAMHDIRGVLR